jgi:drug/metabolite transporter (DMT)-like permease
MIQVRHHIQRRAYLLAGQGTAILPAGWPDRIALGMGLALAAYSLLALQDATVKWLVATVPVWQVLFVRAAILVAFCLATGGRPLLRHIATTPTLPLLGLRGLVTLTAWFCYFSAARALPLGQLTTLWFTAPVIIVLLAGPVLGERVGLARWSAVSVGFAGAVLAADPGGIAPSWSAALVLFAAILWGIGVMLTRRIARHEKSLVQMLANNFFFLVVTGAGTAFSWHTPTWREILLLIQVALLGGAGQFCLFESVRHAPASVLAPLEYVALIWAFALGFLIWGDIPGPFLFGGATLILLAGLFIVLSERVSRWQK